MAVLIGAIKTKFVKGALYKIKGDKKNSIVFSFLREMPGGKNEFYVRSRNKFTGNFDDLGKRVLTKRESENLTKSRI